MKCTIDEMAKMLIIKGFLGCVANDENIDLKFEITTIGTLTSKDIYDLACELVEAADKEAE